MRRIAALLVGLVLVAGTVEAQAVKCSGFSLGGQPKVYWGGFAVCADWCGAY